MEEKLKRWVLWFTIIILAAFILPFTLLQNIQRFYGSFLFWGLFAILAIISVGLLTKNWRD